MGHQSLPYSFGDLTRIRRNLPRVFGGLGRRGSLERLQDDWMGPWPVWDNRTRRPGSTPPSWLWRGFHPLSRPWSCCGAWSLVHLGRRVDPQLGTGEPFIPGQGQLQGPQFSWTPPSPGSQKAFSLAPTHYGPDLQKASVLSPTQPSLLDPPQASPHPDRLASPGQGISRKTDSSVLGLRLGGSLNTSHSGVK